MSAGRPATSFMGAFNDAVERAAVAAYAKTAELASKFGHSADQYPAWDDVSSEWQAAFKATIKAALLAVLRGEVTS